MAKTILTPQQLNFLELIGAEKQITQRFYLTGGTALSEFYLQHRLSYDLDFFCEKEEVEPDIVEAFLRKVSSKLSVIKIKKNQFLGLFSYVLVNKENHELKVDFNYYPFPRISKGLKYNNLEIDSLYDIAVNKLHTIFMKPRNRDYLDLYFILKNEKYTMDKLIIDAKTKFDWHIDRINLASQLLRVKELNIKDIPKILVPFKQKEMENFFLKLVRSLEKDIFK